MTVISEVCGGREEDDREYPWLGDSGVLVVLFSEHGVGTLLAIKDSISDAGCVGEYSDDWDMDMFEPFCGRVTLANDDVEIVELDEEPGE